VANILVVDDEADVLEALARALRLAGHAVSSAASPAQAIQLCVDNSFDVVVLDYIMPSMTGIALLNKIRTYHPTIRSIIVSGKIDIQQSEEALSAELKDRIEADAYLHKPLENPRLVETIKSLLNKDETRSWEQIAERNINAKKREVDVRDAERAMRQKRKKQ